MRIRATCVTAEEVGRLVGDVGVWLEDTLAHHFDQRDFGGEVEQFVAVFIAVDSDGEENERFATSHDKGGKYKDFRTGVQVKFVGVAVRLNLKHIAALSLEQAKPVLARSLIDRLKQPLHRVPSGFRLDEFLREMNAELSKLD
jgi:hypothetical protein